MQLLIYAAPIVTAAFFLYAIAGRRRYEPTPTERFIERANEYSRKYPEERGNWMAR